MTAVVQLARQHLVAYQRVLFIDLHVDEQDASRRQSHPLTG